MSEVTLSDSNFEQEVLKSNTPVLVDFWAPWCQPCKIISPIVEALATEMSGKLKVAKMNVDENQTPSNYSIMSIPTLMVFKNGQVAKTMIGAQSKENIKKGIDEVLNG